MPDLAIEIFSNDIEYDFAHFDCGEESLNIFLTNHLARQHNARILRGYLLVTKEPKPKVVRILHVIWQLLRERNASFKHTETESTLR
jgi:hypothetical protein